MESKSKKLMTIVGMTFLAPMLISGLFGMNGNLPYMKPDNLYEIPAGMTEGIWWWSFKNNCPWFTISVSVIFVSIMIIYVFFKIKLI